MQLRTGEGRLTMLMGSWIGEGRCLVELHQGTAIDLIPGSTLFVKPNYWERGGGHALASF